MERALAECDVSYAIVRPAILFGGDGVLLNNIAWLLRRLPVFAIGGDGDYRIRGIHVDDLARLCLAKAAETHDSVTDAVGPERPTFTELVGQSGPRSGVGPAWSTSRAPACPLLARALGLALHDVLLTAEEYRAMAAGLADTDGPSTGSTACRSGWPSTGRPSVSTTPTRSPATSTLSVRPARVAAVVPEGLPPAAGGAADLERRAVTGDRLRRHRHIGCLRHAGWPGSWGWRCPCWRRAWSCPGWPDAPPPPTAPRLAGPAGQPTRSSSRPCPSSASPPRSR